MKDSKDVAVGDWIEWTSDAHVNIGMKRGARGRVIDVRPTIERKVSYLRVDFLPGQVYPEYDHANQFWYYAHDYFKILDNPTKPAATARTDRAGARYTGLFNLQGNTVQDLLAKMDAEEAEKRA